MSHLEQGKVLLLILFEKLAFQSRVQRLGLGLGLLLPSLKLELVTVAVHVSLPAEVRLRLLGHGWLTGHWGLGRTLRTPNSALYLLFTVRNAKLGNGLHVLLCFDLPSQVALHHTVSLQAVVDLTNLVALVHAGRHEVLILRRDVWLQVACQFSDRFFFGGRLLRVEIVTPRVQVSVSADCSRVYPLVTLGFKLLVGLLYMHGTLCYFLSHVLKVPLLLVNELCVLLFVYHESFFVADARHRRLGSVTLFLFGSPVLKRRATRRTLLMLTNLVRLFDIVILDGWALVEGPIVLFRVGHFVNH